MNSGCVFEIGLFLIYNFSAIIWEKSMKVLKVINNNVVSCTDDKGKEVVVMGCGIGFQAKPNSPVKTEFIEKVFHMETPKSTEKLIELFETLPTEYIEITSQIVEYAKETLKYPIRETIYLTLTDHINFSIERVKQNMNFENALTAEVKCFYPDEFAIGSYAVQYIREKTGVDLPMDDAATIAFHLVSAGYDTSIKETVYSTQIFRDVLDYLKKIKVITWDENSEEYEESAIYIKFIIRRVLMNKQTTEYERQYIHMVKTIYSSEHRHAKRIAEYLKEKSNNMMTESTLVDLTMCIRRFKQE